MFLKLALLLLLLQAAPNGQATSLEYQVKAGYLFNFLKFVEWPWTKLKLDQQSSIKIAVMGRDPFGGLLAAFEKKKVWGRNIEVHYPQNTHDIEGYQLIFFPKGMGTSEVTETLAKIKGKPILTVGEGKNFLDLGGIISLIFRGQNVSFRVHLSRARSAKLYLDSELLNLAQGVVK